MQCSLPNESYVLVLWRGHEALKEVLTEAGKASLLVDAQSTYSKAMVLAAGNWCERRVCEVLVEFAEVAARGDVRVVEVIQRKVVNRKYHTMFDWDSGSYRGFLGMFGEEFRASALKAMAEDSEVSAGATAFMVLGAERNRLAHGHELEAEPEFTAEEVRGKFLSAARWVKWLEVQLLSSTDAGPTEAGD